MNQLTQTIQMARQSYARGDFALAVRTCDQLASRFGARDDLLNIKAVSLLAMGQPEAARLAIRQALKLNPRIASIQLNAASIYHAQCQNKLVKRHALEAIRLAPEDAVVLYQAALLCRKCGDYPRAMRIIDRCLKVKPGFSQAWHLRGSVLMDLGKMEAAQAAMAKSVELEPGNIRALSTLIKLRGDDLGDSKTVSLLKDIQVNGASNADRASAAFVLGNMHRHDDQHENAFSLYLEANTLAATSQPFNIDAWERNKANVMQASANPGALSSTQSGRGANLVFIVGMPRSGTTLCEQVLSSHSGVLACGELATMGVIDSSFARRRLDPYSNEMTGKELELASELYLSALPKDHQKSQCVTDKAPMNFERVGLIHRIFPRAKFLYCTRHPLDTILSCFMHDFQSGLNFTLNLEHISRVFIAHTGLMQHWIKLLPEQIHSVNYEKYIANQETETHRLADFLNLDFEPGMLTPHLQERAVVTASNLQVRQAVHSSSIGRWKHYKTELSEVIEMLQDEGLELPGT